VTFHVAITRLCIEVCNRNAGTCFGVSFYRKAKYEEYKEKTTNHRSEKIRSFLCVCLERGIFFN